MMKKALYPVIECLNSNISLFVGMLTMTLMSQSTFAQVTWTNTGCSGTSPTIDKVFIDACADPEGYNEFAYMTVGSAPYNWSNLSISGSGVNFTFGANTGANSNPSLDQRAISTNFTSNPSVVAALNAGVGTCNPPVFYVAPNPIPPGSAVIIRMSGQPVSLPGGTNPLSSLCGKGPVYVLTGSYNSDPSGQTGFFKNNSGSCNPSTASTNNNPCTRIATFNLGNGCVQEVQYNLNTFPMTFNSTTGAYLTSGGATGTSSNCYEAPACTDPPAPSVSPTLIEYCDGQTMPSTKINCSNCNLTNTYYIYDAATGGNLVYSGTVGSFPPAGFTPAVGNNTYYIGQKFSFCNSTRTPIQINRKPLPTIDPISNKVFCESNSCITITATGTSGASYTWSPTTGVNNPNSGTTQICNSGATSYTLTSNLNGCITTTTVNFSTNNSLQTANIATPSLINCINSSVSLNATPTGSNFTYNWSNGANSAAPSVTTGGTYTLTITDSNNGCTKVVNTTVTEDKSKPSINPIAPVKITCTTSNPNIPITVTGNNLVYNWSPAVNGVSSNPTVSAAGNYTVTVTNSVSGCTDTKTVSVTQDKLNPNASIATPPQLNCYNGGSVTFNTTGTSTGSNYSYSWIGPNGYNSNAIPPPAATQGGTYTLVVTDQNNGCTKTVSVNVSQNTTQPNVTAGPNQILSCYNSGSVQLGIVGSPGWTYQWSNGSTDPQLTVGTTGTYSLTVTDPVNGCTRVSQAVITEDKTIPVVSPIPPITITCSNPNPSVSVNATGGSAFFYAWSPSGSGANPSFTTPGTYTVTVTNQTSGCKTTQTVNISENKVLPNAVIAPPDVLNCYNNGTITLNTTGTSTGNPYTYQWVGGSQSGTTLPLPSITTPGTYSLTVTDPTNGCTKSVSVTVQQNTTVPPVTAGSPKLLNCTNNGLVSIGTNNANIYNYQWSNGATSGIQNITTPGTYTLTVTDPANGCTTVSSVVVTEDKSIPTINDIPAITITCANPSVALQPNVNGNNLTYTWSPSGSGANPAITTPGTYSLTLTDAVSGCTDTKTVVVSEDKVAPTVTILPALTLNCYNNSSIALDPTGTSTGSNFTYQWSGAGGFSSNTLTPPNVTTAGTYTLVVTNTKNGCTKNASVNVTQDIALPNPNTGGDKVLNCANNNSVTIGGAPVLNYTYNWSNNNSNASQIVTQTGSYQLTVTDAKNGCTTTTSVNVTKDNVYPTANAGADITINCYNPSKSINATAGNSTALSYNWSGNGILGGGSTLTPVVNQGGAYILTVTNTNNGCATTDTINVIADKNNPTVAASVIGNLDCNVTSTQLDGNGSNVGPNYTFAWSGPNGFSNTTNLNPSITVGGNYSLVITNVDNGCTSSKTIFVNQDITPPNSNIIAPALISCTSSIVTLQPVGGFNSNYFYSWSTNTGNFVSSTSNYTAQVDKQGDYQLTIVNTANGCTSTSNTTVIEDKNIPQAYIAPATTLTCPSPQVQLSGAGSSTGTNIAYNWTTTDGNIVFGQNSLYPNVNKGGTYTLEVNNITNGCIQKATVTVSDDRIYPSISIKTPPTITCFTPLVTINATNSANGTNYTYTWTALNGGIITSGQNTLSPTVSTNGVYELKIKNNTNQCEASETVIVTQDKNTPTANAGPNQLLTCTNNSVQLKGTASSSAFIVYAWGSSAGKVQNGGNTLTPIVTQPGTYTLSVTNTQNGCAAYSDVTVTTDTNVPIANAGIKQVIDCKTAQVTLDGTLSNNGANYTYVWTTSNGAFVSGQNTLQPIVNQPGTYSLKVKNTTNNCEASASVQVEDNRIKPSVIVATPTLLNCRFPQLNIDASASSQGNEYQYTWTTTNGNLLQGANTPTPTIDKGGSYQLSIKNTANGCYKDTIINVVENFNTPKANILAPALITCVNPTALLDASSSNNTQNAQIQWILSNGAHIFSGENTLKPTIDDAGMYKLILRDTLSQCIDSTEITAAKDANIPSADAGKTQTLNCTIKELSLNATASSAATITYDWNTTDGNIVSGKNTLTPKINKPGIYTLTVNNAANQCVKTANVTILQDTIAPTIVTATPKELNCKLTVTKIDAAGSSVGSKYNIVWTDNVGGILSGATSLSPLVNKAGKYTLKITNTANTCANTTVVEVKQNIIKPTADASVTDTITCRKPKIDIVGKVSSASGLFTYEWKTNNGNFLANQNTLQPTIDKGGTYQLFVTDTINFCVSNTQIEVQQNTITPITDAGQGGNLTCTAQTLVLKATVQNGNTNPLRYVWSTSNGNIITGTNSLEAKIDAPGIYIFKVDNPQNGCFAIDSATVTQDANVPIANIKGGGILDCKNTNYVLDATGSSQGQDFSFEWKTSTGANISSGANTLTPTINGGGTYTLIIKNNSNNCEKTIAKVIEIDTLRANIDIALPILTCKDPIAWIQSQVTGVNNYTVQWTSPNASILSKEDSTAIKINTIGTYSLSAKNTANQCIATKVVTITENKNAPNADAGLPTQLTCNDATFTINANTNTSLGNTYEYLWTTQNGNIISGQGSLTPEVSPQATYTLLVTNKINGCSATDSTTVLSIKPKLDPLTVSQPLCNGYVGAIAFNGVNSGTAPYQYSINGGKTFSNETAYTKLKPAVYSLKVRDANQCEDSTTVTLIDPPIFSLATPKINIVKLGEDIQLDVAISPDTTEIAKIVWTPSATLSCDNCLNPVVANAIKDTYFKVEVTSVNGCKAQAYTQLYIDTKTPIYAPTAFSPNGDNINDFFTLYANAKSIVKINYLRVFDRWGNMLFEALDINPNIESVGWDGNYKGEPLNQNVFVWYAEVERIDGNKEIVKGDVYLQR